MNFPRAHVTFVPRHVHGQNCVHFGFALLMTTHNSHFRAHQNKSTALLNVGYNGSLYS